MQRQMTDSFEKTYRRYDFAPLVTWTLMVATALKRWTRQPPTPRASRRPVGTARAASGA